MINPAADALLPPAILAVLAFVLLVTRRRRAATLAVFALVVFALQGVPYLLIAPLLLPRASPAEPASSAPGAPGAIVVLSSGLPELLDTSRTTPSLETLKRLRTAAALFRRTGVPILVSGARAPDGPVPLAAQMALSLQTDFNVPTTWAETNSTNLWQSAAASADMLRKAGIDRIYLVAQPWELRLSGSVFRAAGLAVTPAPIPHADRRPLGASALATMTPAWLDSALALRQWAGLACQGLAPCAAWMAQPIPDPS